jgi:hypothetical protein
MAQSHGSGAAGTIAFIALLVGLAWFTAAIVLPKYKMNYASERTHRNALNRTASEVQFYLGANSNAILIPLRDDGLDIFVTRPSFESIPYPDREHLTLAMADIWCGDISSVFLPSVRFRDLRTGETMQRQGCALRATVDPSGDYTGTVHNITADLDAFFYVQMVSPDNAIKGCMQVSAPLYGTGPIVGFLDGDKLKFDLREPGMFIQFEGTRIGQTIEGKYVVNANSDARQTGQFTLHQDSTRVRVPNDSDLDHCPRR